MADPELRYNDLGADYFDDAATPTSKPTLRRQTPPLGYTATLKPAA